MMVPSSSSRTAVSERQKSCVPCAFLCQVVGKSDFVRAATPPPPLSTFSFRPTLSCQVSFLRSPGEGASVIFQVGELLSSDEGIVEWELGLEELGLGFGV